MPKKKSDSDRLVEFFYEVPLALAEARLETAQAIVRHRRKMESAAEIEENKPKRGRPKALQKPADYPEDLGDK